MTLTLVLEPTNIQTAGLAVCLCDRYKWMSSEEEYLANGGRLQAALTR